MKANGYKIRLDDSTDVTIWTQDNWIDVGQTQVSLVQSNLAKSQIFDLDNGAGTIIDGVVMKLSRAVTLNVARIVYLDAATGTVAAGSLQVGTMQGSYQMLAEDGKRFDATIAPFRLAVPGALH